MIHHTEVNMSEESEAEKIKLEDDLKNAICQLRMVLRSYDSSKYSVDILAANKVEWIKKVEDCHCMMPNCHQQPLKKSLPKLLTN